MYKCPCCKIELIEIDIGNYKCVQCEWSLSETYVQAWWHGYNEKASEIAISRKCPQCGKNSLWIDCVNDECDYGGEPL